MSIFGPRTALAFFVALPFVAAAALAGCATPVLDPAEPADPLSCTQLASKRDGMRLARTQAAAKQRDPWTFVIPFAVDGRHVAAPSSVDDADRWLAHFDIEARVLGCPVRG